MLTILLLAAPLAGLPMAAPMVAMAAAPTNGLISINFDDGLLSAYTLAAPIMKEYGFKGTAYIYTQPQNEQEPGYYEEFMSWDQVVSLQNNFGWEIGSHGYTHSDLTQMTFEQAKSELDRSKADLINHNINVKSFASPYGSVNQSILNYVATIFDSHRSAWNLANTLPIDKYYLKARPVLPDTDPATVKSWIDSAKANNEWLILYFHSLTSGAPQPANDDYNVNNFRQILDYIKTSNLPVMTNTQGVASYTSPSSSGWNYYQKIIFDNPSRGNLDNVPVLVKLTSGNFDFSHAVAQGQDIRFVDTDDSTILAHEIEYWNQAQQEAEIWVKVPRIDGHSTNDFIYMYYNGPAGNYQNPTNVWSNNYRLVWHMNQSNGHFQDSTSLNLDSTAETGIAYQSAGQLGYGAAITAGQNNYITRTDSGFLRNDPYTWELWYKPTNISATAKQIWGESVRYSIKNNGFTYFSTNTSPQSLSYTGASHLDNTWYYAAFVKTDSGNNRAKIYRNGILYGEQGGADEPTEVSAWTWWRVGGGFGGTVDEVRVSAGARSADWIDFQYCSMEQSCINYQGEEINDQIYPPDTNPNPNLVVNGNFEQGAGDDGDNWIRSDKSKVKIVSQQTGTYPYANRLALINGGSASNSSLSTYGINVEADKKYQLRTLFKVSDYQTGNASVWISEFDANYNYLGGQWLGGFNANYLGERTFNYTPSAGTAKVEIYFLIHENGDMKLEVDNVALKEIF